MLWPIWVEMDDLMVNNNRWDVKKTKEMLWQCLLENARNAWKATHKETYKATNYTDMLGDYGKIWGGNKLLYHNKNTRTMHWNVKAPNVGLVNHG